MLGTTDNFELLEVGIELSANAPFSFVLTFYSRQKTNRNGQPITTHYVMRSCRRVSR
jgi:hypothetical protein